MRISRYFLITMAFFLLLSGVWSLRAEISPKTVSQIQEVDDQIGQLDDVKRGYEARALRHENQGEDLQFRQRDYLEARRHFELAEENREKARSVEKQINVLKQKKEKLLVEAGN
ncbi:MAG: hypothetical protein KGJ02_00730 [Verrucomicrobiota bacterium]|nr:hypothetical protein [Verrucomicrobiota bacterium]